MKRKKQQEYVRDRWCEYCGGFLIYPGNRMSDRHGSAFDCISHLRDVIETPKIGGHLKRKDAV